MFIYFCVGFCLNCIAARFTFYISCDLICLFLLHHYCGCFVCLCIFLLFYFNITCFFQIIFFPIVCASIFLFAFILTIFPFSFCFSITLLFSLYLEFPFVFFFCLLFVLVAFLFFTFFPPFQCVLNSTMRKKKSKKLSS